jgi:hypothetical protein
MGGQGFAPGAVLDRGIQSGRAVGQSNANLAIA